MKNKHLCLLGLFALMLVGGAIRSWPAIQRPMWFDEADTWRSAIGTTPQGMPYSKFLTWQVHFETPPLAFLMARIGADFFDPNRPTEAGQEIWRPEPWTLRLGALVCGVALIPLVFGLGRTIHNETLGLWLAGIVAVDPNMVDQSQQCRMYAMLTWLMVVALVLAIVMIRNPSRKKGVQIEGVSGENGATNGGINGMQASWGMWGWIGLGVVLGLVFATIQFGLVVWVGIVLAAGTLVIGGWISRHPYPDLKGLLVGIVTSYITAVVVASIGFYQLIDRLLHGKEDSPDMALSQIAREIVVYAKDLIRVPPFQVAGQDLSLLGLIVYPLSGLGLWFLFKRCKTSTAVLLGVAVANLIILFPFRRMHHFMDQRYLTGIQPAFWVGLAMLPVALQGRPWRDLAKWGVVLYIGLQTWQVTHLAGWWQQPDRYHLAPAIMEVFDRKGLDDAVAYHPQVIEVLGNYCGLPPTEDLEAGLYEGIGLRPDARVPDGFNAEATWLVLGMINYPGRLPLANETLDVIARHYGVTIDAAQRAEHIRLNHVTVVRLSSQGAEFKTLGVGP